MLASCQPLAGRPTEGLRYLRHGYCVADSDAAVHGCTCMHALCGCLLYNRAFPPVSTGWVHKARLSVKFRMYVQLKYNIMLGAGKGASVGSADMHSPALPAQLPMSHLFARFGRKAGACTQSSISFYNHTISLVRLMFFMCKYIICRFVHIPWSYARHSHHV